MLKGLLVGMVLGLPILWLVLWLMQAGGTLWWLYTWAALVAYQLFVMWIAPNVIMPLFNKFTPLEDATLKERVTALMTRSLSVASSSGVNLLNKGMMTLGAIHITNSW